MKSVKGVLRAGRQAMNRLNILAKEVGAYAINVSWYYQGCLIFQCNIDKLKNFAEKNNLELIYKENKVFIDFNEIKFFALTEEGE